MSCSNSSPNPFSIANHFSPSMKSMCHSLKHLYVYQSPLYLHYHLFNSYVCMYVCMYKCPQSFLPTETRTTQTPSWVHAIASSFTPSWSFSYNLSPLRQGQQQQTSYTHKDWPHLAPPHLIQSEFTHASSTVSYTHLTLPTTTRV